MHHIEQYENAIQCFNESISIKPSKEAYVYKAYSLEKLGDYNNAIECYDRAINLDTSYEIAYNCKGQLLCFIERFEEAKDYFEKAISIMPNYADAYYNIALMHAKIGEIDNTIDFLKKAIEIDEEFLYYAVDEKLFKGKDFKFLV